MTGSSLSNEAKERSYSSAVRIDNCTNVKIGKMDVEGFDVGVDAENSVGVSVGSMNFRGGKHSLLASGVRDLSVGNIVVNGKPLSEVIGEDPKLCEQFQDAVSAIAQAENEEEAIQKIKLSRFGNWAKDQNGLDWAKFLFEVATSIWNKNGTGGG